MIIEKFISQKCIGYSNGRGVIESHVLYKNGKIDTLYGFSDDHRLMRYCPHIDTTAQEVEDKINGTNIRIDNANV